MSGAVDLDELENLFDGMKFEIDLRLIKDNKIILDFDAARLLYYIRKMGTLLGAARLLGISYSKAWFIIDKIERNLGERIIDRYRGGVRRGYSALNEVGIRLLDMYIEKLRALGFNLEIDRLEVMEPDIVFIGSDDSLLREILARFGQQRGLAYEYHVLGSIGGILHIILRDADIVVSHIYDPETGEYNVSYIRKLGLDDHVVVLRGYVRSLVLASKRLQSEKIDECLRKSETIAVRGIGSGTELFLRKILLDYGVKEKIKFIYCDTHRQAAKTVADGMADICVVIEYEAKRFDLEYINLKDEIFDFIVPKEKYKNSNVEAFFDFLSENRDLIEKYHGYSIPPCFLKQIL